MDEINTSVVGTIDSSIGKLLFGVLGNVSMIKGDLENQ